MTSLSPHTTTAPQSKCQAEGSHRLASTIHSEAQKQAQLTHFSKSRIAEQAGS